MRTALLTALVVLVTGCGTGPKEGTPTYAVNQVVKALHDDNELVFDTYVDMDDSPEEMLALLLFVIASSVGKEQVVEDMASVEVVVHDQFMDFTAPLDVRLKKGETYWRIVEIANAEQVLSDASSRRRERLEEVNQEIAKRIEEEGNEGDSSDGEKLAPFASWNAYADADQERVQRVSERPDLTEILKLYDDVQRRLNWFPRF